MRVALDGAPLTMTSGGLRRYTEELVTALRAGFPDDTYEVQSGHDRPLWWSLRLPLHLRMRRFDIFHGTNFEVPYLPGTPSVMTVHDLSPWMNPEWHTGASRVRSRTRFLIGLGIPTMLLTATAAVRLQVIEHFGVHPDRVAAVSEAARITRVPVPPSRPYFLFVGTIEPRKNVPALIAAWRSVRERHRVHLVLAGRTREDGPKLTAEPGLDVAGEVSESRLAELYSGALALVYPSLYEGFGLPVLEAMCCGTPVIASRDPALMEVTAGAAMHRLPHELADAMHLLAGCSAERERLSREGLRRAAEFSWETTARKTREVYAEAIARYRTFS
jgi:glycosyltransferase involved in cell wall biosynthesis